MLTKIYFYLSVYRHGDEYGEIFRKPLKEIQVSLKFDKNNGVLQMKTSSYMWHLADVFLEWEIFQTKFVEEIRTHFLFNNFFPENRTVYEIISINVVETEGPQMTSQHGTYPLFLSFFPALFSLHLRLFSSLIHMLVFYFSFSPLISQFLPSFTSLATCSIQTWFNVIANYEAAWNLPTFTSGRVAEGREEFWLHLRLCIKLV